MSLEPQAALLQWPLVVLLRLGVEIEIGRAVNVHSRHSLRAGCFGSEDWSLVVRSATGCC